MLEATVALCKCPHCGKVYGIRIEKRGQDLFCTWAFPVKENTAARENYGKKVLRGQLYLDESYPGCPYCKKKNFFFCGNCGKLTCWDGGTRVVTCSWCKNTAELSGTIESISGADDA